jgi:hypothetical protein
MEKRAVQPVDIEAEITLAESVAMGDRDAASLCSKGQEALQARFVQSAQTIDRLIELLRLSNFTAQLNHDTIRNRRQA